MFKQNAIKMHKNDIKVHQKGGRSKLDILIGIVFPQPLVWEVCDVWCVTLDVFLCDVQYGMCDV